MKNATKLVWLVMLFSSSIMFAFGQTGANQMTLEQAIAYDNSVVVKSGGGIDLSVPPQNYNVKAILINETFDTGLPASWFQIQYSGSNWWGWVPGIPTFSSYDPPNTDGNFACANGYNYGAHNVGLFTHSMDMSAAAGPDVYINVDRNFQDFAGNGDAALRVYSGGTGPGNLELTLWSQTTDDPSNGVSAAYVINPTTFADPSNVYLEFYYTCTSSTAWGFCFDNLVVNLVLPPGDMYGYVYNGQGLTIVGATVAVPAEGLFVTTDASGYYYLAGIPGGDVEATASKAGYNTISAIVSIPPLGTVQKDWVLTAPTMIIQPTFHEETLNPEEWLTTYTGILNTGNGPLNWTAEVIYPPTDGSGTTFLPMEDLPEAATDLPQGPAALNDKPTGPGDATCEDCDPSAVFANVPDDANAYWSVYGGTYQQYQQVVNAAGGWNTLTWYGVFLIGNNNPAGEPFYIALSTNNGPGGIFVEYNVSVVAELLPSCPLLGAYDHWKYTATIDAQPSDNVWVTIQNADNPTDRWYWTQSPLGSGSSTAPVPLALCLTSSGGAGNWLTLDYYEGTTPGFGTLENVPTNFDAQGTSAGEVYTADLVFTSFDPFVGTTTIPCTMIIAGDPLSPPTDLTAVLTDDIIGTVQLDWLWAGDAFQFFIVKRDGSPIGTSTTTQYIDTPLPDYGTYCYTVQSFYDEGYSVPTEEVCVEWPLPVIFVNPTYHYAEVWVDHQHLWTTMVSNLGVGTLVYDVPPYQSCEHEIVMYDDWGDGWNGGTLDVFVDGDEVLSNVTLSSGSGPGYEYFEANNGSVISTSFTCGSWCYECSYYIYDGFGTLVFSDGVGGVNPTGGSGPAACPGFIVDIDPEHALVPEGSSQAVDVTWDATGFPPGLYYQEFFFESNDPVTPSVTVGNEMLVYVPAQYAGQVTDCESGAPISGVTVTAGAWQTVTDNSGMYSLYVDEGVYTVYFDKLGYETYMEVDTSCLAGVITPLDVCLYESPYAVPWVLATVDYPDEQFCEVEWSLPEGPYELIYDDGVAEDLFVWNAANNENAVKFSPLGAPATVIGGRLYVGDGSFPAGNWLGSEFVIMVYDDNNGLPGNVVDSIGVTVNNYGWVEFWGLSATFDAGEEFYISMLQLYPSPNAAPIGIDATLPNVYRSYSRTALGGQWGLSVYQDFMIRAYVEGPQTDVITESEEVVRPVKVDPEVASKYFTTANNTPFVGRPGTVKAGTTGNIEGYDNSEAVLYYTVALMSDFDPDLGPATGTMTILNNVTELNYTDNNWAGYTQGWYAYAVQVAYSSGMLSPWTYSNIVGRDMDVEVIFEITLCDGNTPSDVEITLTGMDYPYETFFGVTDDTGIYTFPQVWKGTYTIDVYKIGYENYNWDQIIFADVTIPVLLSEKRYPPRNLWVDPLTSYAYWDPPLVVALDQGFEDVTFPPLGWQASSLADPGGGWLRVLDGSSSAWSIPAWDSYYACANDDGAGSTSNGSVDYLITPPLDLREVDTYRLMFDSYYDAYYGLQIATVEYSYDAGANWDVFYALSPQAGSWDYIDQDLSSFSGMTGTAPVWFAFHADDGGGWASGWAIDNVLLANGETDPIQYHVYLDGAFVATTDTTFYQYAYLTYGVTYTASVAAEYSCGLSEEIYYTFGSTFLLPPRNLDGFSFDDAVHLWWEVPIEPITDFSAGSTDYDPNFVAVTDDAEWVSNAPKPVGYKPLSTSRAILWDNGPLVNSPGTGAGGADESVLHSGLGTYGFGCQWPLGYQIADDFEVTGNWNVTDITVYGYQTNSGPPSSFVGCYLEIYDGQPGAGGSVIWGDLVTNVLDETDWTNIYRVNAVGGGTARPIMYLKCSTPGLSLSSGTYWLAYSLDGTGSSGPWTPPITIDGVTTTGNGIQNTGSWGPALDGSFQQGFPFIIEGPGGGGGGGGTPDNFIGYNLYRDMDNIAYIPWGGEDTTHYFDYDLLPLCYEYSVTAVYDLTPYGFPGETGESMHEGPMDICVEYGWPLAFMEDWSTGSFDPNLWDHGDNWRVNGQYGNPMPSAEFTWDPVMTDYKSALTSYPIDGKYHPGTEDPYIDGRIWFDFDLKLDDNGMSGNEVLTVAVWENGTWHEIATFSNADGSFDWTSYHYEITNYAFGEIFRVRFQAEGFNTQNILSWFVDNIHLYRQCDAPFDLEAAIDDPYGPDEVYLTWHGPAGGGPGGGGEWIMWDDGVNVNGIGLTGGGVFSVASHWDPDMITQYDGMSITKIRFVPYANASGSVFTLKIWEGPNAGTLLHEQAVGSYIAGEWNEYTLTTPVAIDASQELWFGYTVDSPDGENPAGNDDGPVVQGYGDMITLDGSSWDPISTLGPFDLNWNLQAYVADADGSVAPLGYTDNTVYSTPDAAPAAGTAVSGVSVPVESSRALQGYNIYFDDATGTYSFADFTTDTFYLHTYDFMVGETYCYYVTAVWEDCEPASEEVCITATGISDPALADGIAVYPNPARDILNITSSTDITHVTVMNYVGQVVYNQKVVEDNDLQLNVAGYETGVYMVKVETTAGILIKKVTIAH